MKNFILMKRPNCFDVVKFSVIVIVCLSCSSCTTVKTVAGVPVEIVKTLWGSSTRVLEQARDKAARTYDKPYWDCLNNAVAIVQKHWVVFKKDEIKGYMVVMGVRGAVNTTEVGIFFEKLSDIQTRIEVSSLSTNAKRMVAKILFHELDIAFGLLPPDPPEAPTKP